MSDNRTLLRAFAGESRRGWPTTSQRHAIMRDYQQENLEMAAHNPWEQRVWTALNRRGAPYRNNWERQYVWGHRIFDFFCSRLGVAIEVDGATHNRRSDLAQDRWHARRSAIATFRIPNGDDYKLYRVLRMVKRVGRWKDRRKRVLGLAIRYAEGGPCSTSMP